MARRDREPAVRIRLVPDTDAVVSRNGVHFLRGREAFWLDDRGVAKLVELHREIEELVERGLSRDEALGAVLAAEEAGAAPS